MSFITIIFLICAYIFNFDSKDEFVWIMVFCGFVEVIFSGRLLLLLPLMICNYFASSYIYEQFLPSGFWSFILCGVVSGISSLLIGGIIYLILILIFRVGKE
jgi:hypothetical protein